MRMIALFIFLLATAACDNAAPLQSNVAPPETPAPSANLTNADDNRAAAPPTELVWEDRPFPRPRRVSNLDVTLKSGKVLDRRLHYYCEVHGGELREELAPLYFGHPGYGNPEENRARAALSPWAVWHHNECNVDHHEQALITYCEMCRLVEPTWRADLLRTAQRRHSRYAIEELTVFPSKPGEKFAQYRAELVDPAGAPRKPALAVKTNDRDAFVTYSPLRDLAGSKQAWVRRLGANPVIGGRRARHPDGIRYGAGGSSQSFSESAASVVPPGRYPFENTFGFGDLPPGDYELTVEYTFDSSRGGLYSTTKPVRSNPCPFTIRDDGTLFPGKPVKNEPVK